VLEIPIWQNQVPAEVRLLSVRWNNIAQGLVEVVREEWLAQLAWMTPFDCPKFWGAVGWRNVRNFLVVRSWFWNIEVR
jgi:hypothetical protein